MVCNLKRLFSIISIHSAFEEERELDFYFNGEHHDFWEIVYVAAGQSGVTEDERVYELESGDIIFHRPMEFHKVWSRGTKKPHVFTMSFKTTGVVPTEIGDGIIHLNSEETATFLDIFKQAYFLMNTKEPREMIAEQKFTLDLERFIIYLVSQRTVDTTISKSIDAKRYSTVITVMQKHINENLSVEDIARLSYMATSTMKNAFSKYSDCGVKKHFIRMKIIASLTLIKEGISIAEISEHFSFSSQNYFSKIFKEEMGVSPTEYKKRL